MMELLKRMDCATAKERLQALREVLKQYESGELEKPQKTNYVNNHVHTTYSFSPYNPTTAAFTAWKNGLQTVGIMDHDSIAGAKEFVEAGKIIGIATTCGFECRCDMSKTPFRGKRINNPDQISVAYLAAHGIPHQNIDAVQAWLTPYREKREQRNRAMVDNLNNVTNNEAVKLDYDDDVRSISMASEGGSVTERHILFALAKKIKSNFETSDAIINFLTEGLGLPIQGKNKTLLSNETDPMYEYYILGVLKGYLVEKFYINATEECPQVSEFIRFVKSVGGISAYAYLGDVTDSVTGDKKALQFEDAYINHLVEWLAAVGFNAVTYMPTRNTKEQLERIIALCDRYELFQISGEDINTPFQLFICKALDEPQFKHLINSTWALVGHEQQATLDVNKGMFSDITIAETPKLKDRIAYFSKIADKH